MTEYFQGLNYSLANEDTWIEYDLAPQDASSIFSVCGSGSRVLPLIAKNPGELHVVDLSDTQLRLLRLRLAAVKNLSYDNYLFMLGYVPYSKTAKRDQLMLELKLSQEDQKHWREKERLWIDNGFIYLGKWERHFMKIGKLFQTVTFSDLAPLFEAKNLDEQKKILDKYWGPKLFRLYTKVVMNEWVANKFLYKGSYAGGGKVKTMEVTAAEFVFREVNDLFQHTWLKSNYFMSMIFLNKLVHPESWPAECDRKIFDAIKKSNTQVFYHQSNLLELLKQRPHDFYSLSDTFSYMRDEDVQDFFKTLPKGINQGTKMVIRTFMRRPNFEIALPWKTNPEVNQELARRDCTRMYEFMLLEKT